VAVAMATLGPHFSCATTICRIRSPLFNLQLLRLRSGTGNRTGSDRYRALLLGIELFLKTAQGWQSALGLVSG
jgi:hypothetical protein